MDTADKSKPSEFDVTVLVHVQGRGLELSVHESLEMEIFESFDHRTKNDGHGVPTEHTSSIYRILLQFSEKKFRT